MKRLGLFAAALAALSWIPVTTSAELTGSLNPAPSVIADDMRPQGDYVCCWVYFFGRWICIPCA